MVIGDSSTSGKSRTRIMSYLPPPPTPELIENDDWSFLNKTTVNETIIVNGEEYNLIKDISFDGMRMQRRIHKPPVESTATTQYHASVCELHSPDSNTPAVLDLYSGEEKYYFNGLLHRDESDGPAVKSAHEESYYYMGKGHCTFGPCSTKTCHFGFDRIVKSKIYAVMGEVMSKEQFVMWYEVAHLKLYEGE